MKEPILSSRFDVEDIRKLREYNSWRHSQMTTAGLKLAEPPGKYSAK